MVVSGWPIIITLDHPNPISCYVILSNSFLLSTFFFSLFVTTTITTFSLPLFHCYHCHGVSSLRRNMWKKNLVETCEGQFKKEMICNLKWKKQVKFFPSFLFIPFSNLFPLFLLFPPFFPPFSPLLASFLPFLLTFYFLFFYCHTSRCLFIDFFCCNFHFWVHFYYVILFGK